MTFEAELPPYQTGNERSDPSQLRMPEGVLCAGREELTVWGFEPFRDCDNAVSVSLKSVGDLPTVLDPFCGGGSTLVEAQRLGTDWR